MDGTVFIALLGSAFFFFLYPTRNFKEAYTMTSTFLFLAISVIMFSGDHISITTSVSTTMTTVNGTFTGTETATTPIITHNGFSSLVLGALFLLLAILSLLSFFLAVTQNARDFKRNISEIR